MAPQALAASTTMAQPSATLATTGSTTCHKPVVVLIVIGLCLVYTFSYLLHRYMTARRLGTRDGVSDSPERDVSTATTGSRVQHSPLAGVRLTLNLGNYSNDFNPGTENESKIAVSGEEKPIADTSHPPQSENERSSSEAISTPVMSQTTSLFVNTGCGEEESIAGTSLRPRSENATSSPEATSITVMSQTSLIVNTGCDEEESIADTSHRPQSENETSSPEVTSTPCMSQTTSLIVHTGCFEEKPIPETPHGTLLENATSSSEATSTPFLSQTTSLIVRACAESYAPQAAVPAQAHTTFEQQEAAQIKPLSKDQVEAIASDPKLAPVQGPLLPLTMHPRPTRIQRLTMLFGFDRKDVNQEDPEKDPEAWSVV
ncbi:hypothetical protein BU15DRAFT_77002 [Melanogaster broomeanus]|nr:hypothetical protein BU15DRAFT_77002 [Melanogaster broomeanus]